MSVQQWKQIVETLLSKGEPGMIDTQNIRPIGSKIRPLSSVSCGVHPYHNKNHRDIYKETLKAAEIWRLNDERNKQEK